MSYRQGTVTWDEASCHLGLVVDNVLSCWSPLLSAICSLIAAVWVCGLTGWVGGLTVWVGGLTGWVSGLTGWVGGLTVWVGGLTVYLDSGAGVEFINYLKHLLSTVYPGKKSAQRR